MGHDIPGVWSNSKLGLLVSASLQEVKMRMVLTPWQDQDWLRSGVMLVVVERKYFGWEGAIVK